MAQSTHIGKHVTGVGKERERVGEDPTDHFGQHEACRNDQDDPQPLRLGSTLQGVAEIMGMRGAPPVAVGGAMLMVLFVVTTRSSVAGGEGFVRVSHVGGRSP